ncbi:hypothetical protein OX958_31025 [Kribbella sp. CA-293567]|nr:hypothetical protein [Kribbella sp. CA-293567]WBQ04384.1 hypothetical protein OX958_31025 [Kribbella sp. CA-293567]
MSPEPRDHVGVWFGDHKIAGYSATPALAARYAGAMRRRFPSLRVTREPILAQQDLSPTTEDLN